jgi:hypothetical protein
MPADEKGTPRCSYAAVHIAGPHDVRVLSGCLRSRGGSYGPELCALLAGCVMAPINGDLRLPSDSRSCVQAIQGRTHPIPGVTSLKRLSGRQRYRQAYRAVANTLRKVIAKRAQYGTTQLAWIRAHTEALDVDLDR